jgi:two-component system CheB/CheR fusion protein
MDLISCRNVLIYLDTIAQKSSISTFHYALNDGGLMLGSQKRLGHLDLFELRIKNIDFIAEKLFKIKYFQFKLKNSKQYYAQ